MKSSKTTASGGATPIQFILDGINTPVNEDTVTPGNSTPLPVRVLNPDGTPADFSTLGSKIVTNAVYFEYTGVDNTSWTTVLASTAADSTSFTYFESGGYPMELGSGGIGSETRLCVVPPGGFNGEIPIKIAAGTRLSVRCLQNVTVGPGNPDPVFLALNLLK